MYLRNWNIVLQQNVASEAEEEGSIGDTWSLSRPLKWDFKACIHPSWTLWFVWCVLSGVRNSSLHVISGFGN